VLDECARRYNGHRPHQGLRQEPSRRQPGHTHGISARIARTQVLSGRISEYRRSVADEKLLLGGGWTAMPGAVKPARSGPGTGMAWLATPMPGAGHAPEGSRRNWCCCVAPFAPLRRSRRTWLTSHFLSYHDLYRASSNFSVKSWRGGFVVPCLVSFACLPRGRTPWRQWRGLAKYKAS
jgi:hypothetical protein